MINLVHFYDRPGGIEILLPGIIKALNEREFSAFVIRPHDGTIPSVYSDTGIEVIYGSRKNLKACLKLGRYARHRKDEIFHIFNAGPLFLLVLRIAGIKRLIYSIHGTIYWHNRIEKFVLRLIWRMAIDQRRQIFTSNSKYSGQVFRDNIAPGISCELLYNYIDSGRFMREVPSAPGKEVRKIIYVGRLAPGKGLYRWVEIALSLHQAVPQLFFEIYGEGQLKADLMKKISDAGAAGFIQLKGHRNDIENVYREAGLLLFLSEYESFGNVVVESILCGTPVLVTDIPSMKEIFSEFPEFILKSSPPSAEEILRKLSGITYLREVAEKAGKVFRERFSIDKHIEKLTDIYAKI